MSQQVFIQELQNIQPLVIFELFRLRSEVFVVEQQCVYQDLDEDDLRAFHGWMILDEMVVACLRILKRDDGFKIGRLVVHSQYRNAGLARKMMLEAHQWIQSRMSSRTKLLISAQTYLVTFYSSLGYHVNGNYYLEDGIPHADMEQNLTKIVK